MAGSFDPYHKWLSILPEEQPPTLYRLLGIALFEQDGDVIESAADRQSSHLRSFQAGKHRAASQKLLNEVAQARVKLLNPAEKAAYDQQLRQQMEQAAQAVAAPVAVRPVKVASQPAVNVPVIAGPTTRQRMAERSRRGKTPRIAGGLALAAVLLLVIGVVAMNLGGDQSPQPQPTASALPAAATGPPAVESNKRPIPARPPTENRPKPPTAAPPNTVPPITVPPTSVPPTAVPPTVVSRGAPPVPSLGELPQQLTIDLPGDERLELVLIPAGEFMMGSSEEEREAALVVTKAAGGNRAGSTISTEGPQHRVKISRPFYLGKYEVTQAQWQAVMGDNPSAFQDPSHPVEQVSWQKAQNFLEKLNESGTRQIPSATAADVVFQFSYALPTEAQWEYACRAGTTTAFSFGDDGSLLEQYGWIAENAADTTHPVGGAKPNAWGLYDMYGNVEEWCADWFGKDYYAASPVEDPTGPDSSRHRVVRGLAWRSPAPSVRSAFRDYGNPNSAYTYRGFRIALNVSAASSQASPTTATSPE